MDVTCERCKAEYEFDDSLLGEKGTTVKCSSCQHVFRVAPPRKDARPMMKLRFRANGIIAPITSLRELQQRIQAGQIGPDDELGRDGAPWRKLQDVPELRGFFAAITDEQPTATRARPAGLAVSQNSMPIPPNSVQPAKRTMAGVGPSQAPSIPRSPQVPTAASLGSFESKPPSASTPLRAPEPRAAPTDAMATTHASLPPPAASLPPPAISSFPPVANAHAATPLNPRSLASAPAAAATKPESMSASPSLPPSGKASFAPGASTSTATSSGAPAGGRGLYLADDEAPPARATEGNKSWLYIGAAGLLAVGGWLGVSALSNKSEPATPTPRVETPAVAPTQETPPDPNAAIGAAAGANSAVAPEPSKAPSKIEAEEAAKPGPEEAVKPVTETAKPAPETAKPSTPTEPTPSGQAEERAESEKPSRAGGSSGSSSEPTDYAGWLTRGAKLFKQNKLEEARAAYTKALELRASGSEANAGLGAVLVASDQAQAAVEPLERAARAGYAEANVTLGDAYRKLGRKEDALEAYNTYVARFPSGSRAAYAKLQASALGGGGKPAEPANEEPAGGPVDYKPAGEPPTPAEPAP
jgi:predicted Zn finger-like uncharacterized protein